MKYTIRPAQGSDKAAIAAFTRDTFEWGDYVADAFDRWLIDPGGTVLVAADVDDVAVAIGRGTMLSPTELWLQGARVHPEWRRLGIASALDDAMETWARRQGAVITRLAVDDWNTPAQQQVEKVGLRPVATWVNASRDVHAIAPAARTNGGRRRPPLDRLVAAPSAETAPAYMAWSSGELGRAARGLTAIGWTWRRLTPNDLVAGTMAQAFWMCPAGWVLGAVDGDALEVGWLEAGPDEVGELLKSTLDLAAELDAQRLVVKAPAVDWLVGEMTRTGFELRRLMIYEKAL